MPDPEIVMYGAAGCPDCRRPADPLPPAAERRLMRSVSVDTLPVVTADQMREVDRIMMEDIGIGILQMMENAGRSLADLCLELYSPASVTILAGPGGNGGGGMAAARHLANRGISVNVVLAASRERLAPATHSQLAILEQMGVGVSGDPSATDRPDVVIDALVGYSLAGSPHGRVATLIAWANGYDGPVISLDVPSGFDAGAGQIMEPCVQADATLTIAALKVGLIEAPQSGALYVTDISVPLSVYRSLGYEGAAIFEGDWVVRIKGPQEDA